MEFLGGVLKWGRRIFAAVVLGMLAVAVIVVPGVIVDKATNSLGWGVVVSLAILLIEAILGAAVIIELTAKTVRFTQKKSVLLWRIVEEFFK